MFVRAMVAAPCSEVWSALLQPEDWWPSFSLQSWVSGAVIERWTGSDGTPRITRGQVLALVPERLLRLSWADDDWDVSTVVEIGVEVVDPDRTEVRVTHLGWEQFGDQAPTLRAAHEAGWRFHLDQLRQHCAR